jgi:hypothetical protein
MLISLPKTMIHSAPDATSFLSTTTVLVGIFVTIVGTSMVQLLAQDPIADFEITVTPRGLRTPILGILLVVDIWGVGFPFVLLYLNTLNTIDEGLVRAVLISTILVIGANLILPIVVIQTSRSLKELKRWMDLDKLSREQQAAKVHSILVDGGFLSAADYDAMIEEAKAGGQTDKRLAKTFMRAWMRAFIMGKPGRVGVTISRTIFFYLIVNPVLNAVMRFDEPRINKYPDSSRTPERGESLDEG